MDPTITVKHPNNAQVSYGTNLLSTIPIHRGIKMDAITALDPDVLDHWGFANENYNSRSDADIRYFQSNSDA